MKIEIGLKTFKEDISRFIYNLGVIRVFGIPYDFDISRTRNLRWREIIYCAPNLWGWVIKSKIRGEHVPSGVVILGAPLSRADANWAVRTAKRLGVGTPEK